MSATVNPRRVADLLSTIRGRIFVAFLIMSLITGALGLYATLGIRQAGVLVNRTYDQSLMSINYARAAATDFAKMRAVFVRRTIAPDAATRARLDEELAELAINLAEDLTIAVERSQSDRAARAGIAVQGAVSTWDEIRRSLDLTAASSSAWEALDRQAAMVDGQIDLLVNYTAGDGFTYRQTARTVVASEIRFYAFATGIALLLSAVVAWLLNRRIMRPVKAASAAAERIAAGRLDDAIPIGGRDELGALLRAMGTMRDNIRAMMAREVSQRRSAQAMLADALESSREGVVVVDAEGRIALANAQAADFFGGASGAMEAGTPVAALTARGADPAAGVLDSARTLARDGEVRLADGRWLRVSRSATQAGGFVAVCSDISVLKEQEERLTTTNLRLDAALDNMSQGLCLYDSEYRLMVVNRRYCEIYGLPPGSIVAGMSAHDVLSRCIEAGNHPGRNLGDLVREETEAFGRLENRTFLQELGDGRIVSIEKRATADGGFVATYEDVTERRHAEARIAFMARHDALTNLPNRILLGEQIDSAIAQAGRDSWIRGALPQPRRLQARQRHPRPPDRRRAAARRREPPRRLPAGDRQRRAPRGRRVRGRAARRRAAGGRRRPGAPIIDVLGAPYALDGPDRHDRRQHRHLPRPERRHVLRQAPQERRRRPLPGQGGGARLVPLLRAGDGRPPPGPAPARARPARGGGGGELRAALPADLRSRRRARSAASRRCCVGTTRSAAASRRPSSSPSPRSSVSSFRSASG